MKKIMFNDRYGLTKAVLEGRKTQTRRIITTDTYNRIDWKAFEEGNYDCVITDDAFDITDIRYLSKYRAGEEVAVAQSYKDARVDPFFLLSPLGDGVNAMDSNGWDNKMFVRADLMPHRIKITNIRVERLQDISDKDCLKEGIECKNERYVVQTYKGVVFYTTDVKLAYKYLIDKICGRGTWDRNTYVFVYDFELIK